MATTLTQDDLDNIAALITAATSPLATAAALAVVDTNVDAVKYITDQLNVTAVTQVSASKAGHFVITAGLTFNEPVSGLVIPANWTKAYWTLKQNAGQTDSQAIIQLRTSNPTALSDGLIRINGAAPATPILKSDGSLTVEQAGGRVVIYLTDELTARLSKAGSSNTIANALGWDVKFVDDEGESIGKRGTAAVVLTETGTTV